MKPSLLDFKILVRAFRNYNSVAIDDDNHYSTHIDNKTIIIIKSTMKIIIQQQR